MSPATLFRRQPKLAVRDLAIGLSLAEFQDVYSDAVVKASADETGLLHYHIGE